MLITSKAGELWVYEEGQTDPSVALDLTAQVCANSAERGLLGVAVDPNFATNHYVYLYYTAQVGPDCDSRNEVNRGVALYYERERRGRNDRGRRSRRQHPVAQRGP